ncbi:MAG: hypothetical protein LBQ40_02825 [Clostridiales bacterium]|nr:hypothetical protein [Clostridiales bacterium]
MKEFTDVIAEIGLNVCVCKKRPPISSDCYKLAEDVKFNDTYYLSLEKMNEILLYEAKYTIYSLNPSKIIEYSAPRKYQKKGETDILDWGRLWIDSESYDYPIYKQFEKLRRWIKKNYTYISEAYIAPHMTEDIACGRVIAAVNSGSIQIVDEEMKTVCRKTWLCNCRLIDGELVDNTDERFYRRD